MGSVHKTVLLNETIEGLNLKDGDAVLDATFGGGGHSREILKRFPNTKIVAFDQDKSAWEKAKEKFKGLEKNFSFVNENFRNITSSDTFAEVLGFPHDYAQPDHPQKYVGLTSSFNGIVFDLGLSSDQLENSGRGFSFMKDEPLLMTMKAEPTKEDLTAMDIVNTWSEKSLADIIYGYGGERFSRRIARGIVEAREKKKIETTKDLVDVIEGSVPSSYRRGRIHCATKTFQALRIAVNDELGALKDGLTGGWSVLKVGGRMAVISFHSLEDRIAKRFYKDKEKEGKAKLINEKPIIPSREEIKNNGRSRSAKLRILEKIVS